MGSRGAAAHLRIGDLVGERTLTRRAVLRRGAVTGGTLVWAVPTVQLFARPAFAQGVGSEPPPDPGPSLSYLAIIVRRAGSPIRYKLKYEIPGGWVDPGPGPNRGQGGTAPIGIPGCESQVPEWRAATPLVPTDTSFLAFSYAETKTSKGVTQATLTLAPAPGKTDVWELVTGAGKSGTSCTLAVPEPGTPTVVVFTSPAHVAKASTTDETAEVQSLDEPPAELQEAPPAPEQAAAAETTVVDPEPVEKVAPIEEASQPPTPTVDAPVDEAPES